MIFMISSIARKSTGLDNTTKKTVERELSASIRDGNTDPGHYFMISPGDTVRQEGDKLILTVYDEVEFIEVKTLEDLIEIDKGTGECDLIIRFKDPPSITIYDGYNE